MNKKNPYQYSKRVAIIALPKAVVLLFFAMIAKL